MEKLSNQTELLDLITDAVVSTDADLGIRTWNKAAEKMYGWTSDEALGHNVDELLHTEFVGISRDEALKRLAQDGSARVETMHQDRHGRKHFVESILFRLKNERGETTGTLGVMRDFTERKEAEEARRLSEQKYRNLFTAMVSGAVMFKVIAYNKTGGVRDVLFLEVNAAFEKLTGFSRDQVVEKSILEFWPDTEQIWFDQVDTALRDGQSMMEGFHRPSNKHFRFSVFKLDNRLLGATFSDISTLVETERALEQSRQALETEVKDRTAEVDDANIAMRVILKQHSKDRQGVEEKILSNINIIIHPLLKGLKTTSLSPHQLKLLDGIHAGLDDIVSSLGSHFQRNDMRLSPTENRVVSLIRQAKSTKDIAAVLGVATRTIDFHRQNIRRKLRLGREINLQSYLNSIE